jgi:DNA-binding MarR family transcriptional regulator
MIQALLMQDPTVPDVPDSYDQRVVNALRRIIHAADIHSRWLRDRHDVTASQLVTLLSIARQGSTTMARIARDVHLMPSTLVGIIDRLEAKGWITRTRDAHDRRMVFLALTPRGKDFMKKAPSPLQAQLGEALARLPVGEQATIASSLERVVHMMQKHVIDDNTPSDPAMPPETPAL